MKYLLAILAFSAFSALSFAAEESFDLDSVEEAPPKAASTHQASKFSLMGRVDLVSETTAMGTSDGDKHHSLSNNHFLVFLKVKASPKVSFMGEFVNKSFYYVSYEPKTFLSVQFGKILVPFGDTRRFHHFYGGSQGLGAQGIMLPNVWAEEGANFLWKLGSIDLDTYWVNSISADDAVTDPDLHDSTSERQAVGFRLTSPLPRKLTAILSAYGGEHWSGRTLALGGLDLYSDYGALDLPVLKDIRLASGIAQASIHDSPQTGYFEKIGDYVELSSRLLGPGEIRLRYGTYIDNSKLETQDDTRSMSAGYIFNLDVIRVSAEYQWNYEAINEIDNDVTRVMASLDF